LAESFCSCNSKAVGCTGEIFKRKEAPYWCVLWESNHEKS
jgi:hypothetical protein